MTKYNLDNEHFKQMREKLKNKELDDDALKEGQVLSRSALNQIAQCRLLDDWPSWCQAGVKSLSLPRWAYSTPIEQ